MHFSHNKTTYAFTYQDSIYMIMTQIYQIILIHHAICMISLLDQHDMFVGITLLYMTHFK